VREQGVLIRTTAGWQMLPHA